MEGYEKEEFHKTIRSGNEEEIKENELYV